MRANLASLVVLLALTPAPRAFAQPATLKIAWEYPTPKLFPQGIVADQLGRPFLHVALKSSLAILDVSQANKPPKEVATLGVAQFGGLDVMHLTQKKDVVYLALGNFFDPKGSMAGLATVSVQNPRAPKVLSLWKSAETLHGSAIVLVQGTTAYLGAMDHGVFIFDVADPAKIRLVSKILPDVHFPQKNPGKTQHPNARGLAIKDHLLYVAYDAGGLRVIDVKDRLKPREIGRYVNAAMLKKQQAYNNVVLDGTTALLAVDYAGLELIDIRDPQNMKQVSWWNPWQAHTLGNLWFNSPGHTNQLEYDAKRRLVYLSAGDSDLQVVDISDKQRPKLAASFGGPKDQAGVWGLTLGKDHVYLAYITAIVPFQSKWAGIKAVQR